MSVVDKFGIPYKKRKNKGNFDSGKWCKYYKKILEVNENIKKQIKQVVDHLAKLNYDKIIELETLL